MFKVTVDRDMRAVVQEDIRKAERAVSAAMRTGARLLKEDWRQQLREAGLGQR